MDRFEIELGILEDTIWEAVNKAAAQAGKRANWQACAIANLPMTPRAMAVELLIWIADVWPDECETPSPSENKDATARSVASM